MKTKDGFWPDVCVQRAFVEGAQWWQLRHNGSTMFPSERDEAAAEAVKRYGDVQEAVKPEYWLSHATIEKLANRVPSTDEENDVRQLSREFLLNEKRLERALRKLARNMKGGSGK